ncbi:MAG: nitrophenyl compound nitroreductase subunit ArsF family protein [Phycisphaerales bacterium]
MTTATSTAARSPMKAALGITLAVLAVGAVAFGLMRESQKSRRAEDSRLAIAQTQPTTVATSSPMATAPLPAAPIEAAVTTVYYFHGDTRCPTCLSIEKQASETVQSQFEAEIAAGRLRFLSVNYDTPEHRHFREDYQLSFGSVVVATGTRFENLSDVWSLVHDERPKFDANVVEHVAAFLKDTP